jgi:ABC-type sugar transport system, ATPase component
LTHRDTERSTAGLTKEETMTTVSEGGSTSMPTGTPVLALDRISKRFGAVRALSDVRFEAHAGEVVALVGDNGAGKSTLVKVIAGVDPADEGEIRFQGERVVIPNPHAAQNLGMATVFQDLALCDNLDVVANLFLGNEVRRHRRLDEATMEKRSWDLLRELSARLPNVRLPVAALSGGQRQTVAICRSLLGEPKLIALDEPTAALGVAQTAQVLNLIEQLRNRGLAVVLISHNMQDVFAVADRITVLRLGRNAGEFRVKDTTNEEVVAAITGATDNVVSERARRGNRASGQPDPEQPGTRDEPGGRGRSGPDQGGAT